MKYLHYFAWKKKMAMTKMWKTSSAMGGSFAFITTEGKEHAKGFE